MKAIVYTSNTGHTAKYAYILSNETNLPAYSLKEGKKYIKTGEDIIYLGWVFANTIKGYKSANKKYNISAVCAIGLCETGTQIPELRKINKISNDILLFTMQGGIDKPKLRGINKFMIKMLIKSLTSQNNRNENDERMLRMITIDKCYVCKENTSSFMDWYKNNK